MHQGGAVVGASHGAEAVRASGGCSSKDLPALPGYGKPADEKAKAKKLLAEAGYAPQNPLESRW